MTRPGDHARKQALKLTKAKQWEADALKHNQLHNTFFNMPHIPVREIRAKLDPQLRAHEIREIMKVEIGVNDETAGWM